MTCCVVTWSGGAFGQPDKQDQHPRTHKRTDAQRERQDVIGQARQLKMSIERRAKARPPLTPPSGIGWWYALLC